MIIITHVTPSMPLENSEKKMDQNGILYDGLSSCRGFDAESSECSKGLLG